jgi:hypothetical protein
MKRPKSKVIRTVNLHGAFAPEGDHLVDQAAFFEFWLAAQARLRTLQNKDLSRRKLEFANFREVANKSGPIFRQLLHDELSPAEAGEKIGLLVKDKKLQRKVFDHWVKAYQTTPKQLERNKRRIAQEEKRLAQEGRILAARETISQRVTELRELATAGNEHAAKALVEAAYLSGLAVISMEKGQGEMMKRIARRESVWPVLTDGKPGWEQKAAAKLTELNLGADLTAFRTRFRQAREPKSTCQRGNGPKQPSEPLKTPASVTWYLARC